MLIPLRTLLARRRTGTATLWVVAAMLLTVVVGHAPADAAVEGHGDHGAASTAPGGEAPTAGGPAHGDALHLPCSVGDVLCAVGIVLGILLWRRQGPAPHAVGGHRERDARRSPGPRLRPSAALRPQGATRLVRLQI